VRDHHVYKKYDTPFYLDGQSVRGK
jgi:hypothetical protein